MDIFRWLKVSNRPKHLAAGCIIFIVWFLFFYLFGLLSSEMAAITGTVSVCIAMCTVEFIQRYSGIGIWDWLDIAAGILIPVLATVIVVACS